MSVCTAAASQTASVWILVGEQLPSFQARRDWSDVRLPDNSDTPAKQAIEVDGHLLGSNPETGAIGPRFRSPAPTLPSGWREIASELTGNGGADGVGSSARDKLEKSKAKAKDKLKKVKKVSADMCDGVAEMKVGCAINCTEGSGTTPRVRILSEFDTLLQRTYTAASDAIFHDRLCFKIA